MKIYVDLDGVMGDFDTHYIQTVGALPPKWRTEADIDVDWEKVKAIDFYSSMPLMHDAMVLWNYLGHHNPIILTGCPKVGREQAEANKRGWVSRYLGPSVPVITCLSKEKSLHAEPGDLLIDDWEKYMHLWVAAGGLWITHVSAHHTIQVLKRLGL